MQLYASVESSKAECLPGRHLCDSDSIWLACWQPYREELTENCNRGASLIVRLT